MKEKKILGRIVVCSDFKYTNNRELQKFFDTQIEKLITLFPKDAIIVLGGDGTMLEAIRNYLHLKIPFLGLNFGTKGFLMHPINSIINNNFILKKYPLLSCKVGQKKVYAFNEFDIKASEGKMLDMHISINTQYQLRLQADGIIVSTAIGSSGYSSSLGGALLPDGLDGYIMTPKAPWKPKGLSPIIIDKKSSVDIVVQGRHPGIEFYADGQTIETKNDSFHIGVSTKKIPIYIHHTYQDYWKNRMYIEQGFSEKN